jgi:hypothetical protein
VDTLARLLNILIRLCGTGALALGLALWLGYASSLTQLHIGFGIGLVASLWVLAGIAWRNTARGGLVAFAGAWGLVSWILGVTQLDILPGSFHWVVEVAHLATGGIAIAVGGQLASAVASAAHVSSAASRIGRGARTL